MPLVSFATSKRSSCDRCRKQKLRCPNKDDATQPCARCLRAGVPCVMSYTRPRGRLQKDVILPDDDDRRKPANSALSTPSSMLSTGSDTTADDSTAHSWSLLNDYDFFASIPSGYEQGHTPAHDDASVAMHYSPLYDELGTNMHDEPPHILHNAFPKATAAHAEFTSPEAAGHPSIDAASGSTSDLRCQLECEMQLSRLNLDLCRQLQTQMLDRNTMCGEATTTTTTTTTDMQDCTPDTSSALRDVLQSIERYKHVLQSLNAYNSNSNSNSNTITLNTPSPHPQDPASASLPLTFPCMINLTSCFFHIVDLFNAFLCTLASHLDPRSLSSPCQGLQILPELKLAGLPVHDVCLQIKILILAVSHHFATMERLLGLPAELCVSSSSSSQLGLGAPRGLLPSYWIATLLSAKGEVLGLDGSGVSSYVQSVQLSRNSICRLQRLCS